MKNKSNDETEVDESRRKVLTAALLAAPTAMLAGCLGEGDTALDLETQTSALTVAELQALCNAFYAMSNVVELRITMPQADWDVLRQEEPVGGRCNWNFDPAQDRYPWHKATSVTISGSAMPTSHTYSNIGIKKKSHCGSIDAVRPGFKLDFNQYDKHKDELEALIGTSHLLLNNSVQDLSYIRTPLAYFLFKEAGLPYARCNFCKVYINNTFLAVYTNVEQVRERFIENNFSATRKGNLYELEATDDFDAARIPFIDVEKVSPFTNKADLSVAATEVAKGVAGMKKVIDVDQFIKFHAMEFLLKNPDSYNGGIFARGNNTYVYNDVQAVPNPTADGGNVKFKFISFGPDTILRPEYNFGVQDLTKSSLVGGLVRNDPTLSAQLKAQIGTYGDTVFSRANMTGKIKTFIDQMQTILTNLGAAAQGHTAAELPGFITEVRNQLRLVRSAAWLMGGLPSTTTYYFKDPTTGDTLRCSASQHVGGGTTGDWEVVHRAPMEDANDRWILDGARFINEGNRTWLHCSNTIRTPANHLYVYCTANDDTLGSKEFLFFVDKVNAYCLPGTFTLSNRRNGLYLKFGTDDPTPSTGAQRVYQTGPTTATKLVIY